MSTSITAATTPSPATTAAASSKLESEIAEAREKSVSDFNDFLTLLTAQLKNQDPQAPLDSTQFVEQLASFSAVEQQVGTNEKLSRLVAQGEAQEIGQLSGWIGQTVDARGGTYTLGRDGMTVPVPERSGAETVEAVIADADGKTVATVPVEDPSQPFVWSGDKTNGQQAAPGQYGISFSYTAENGDVTRIAPDASGRVTEARIDGDGPVLLLDNGMQIRPADVQALHLAEDARTGDVEANDAEAPADAA